MQNNKEKQQLDVRLRTRGKPRKMPKKITVHTPAAPDPERVLSHTRQRQGTVSLRNLQIKLTTAQAATLEATDIMTVGMFLAEQPKPDATAARPPVGTVTVRLHSLPVPAEDADALAEDWFEDRQARLRAALNVLAQEHAQERWQLTRDLHPGTPLRRERISVGPGRWVARAVWRKKNGLPRSGRGGPTSSLAVTGKQVGLSNPLHDGYELIDEHWDVLELFGAQSLHDAALKVLEKQQLETLPVELLTKTGPEKLKK